LQGIDIHAFYVKRLLRIWHLYFFVIALVIIAMPLVYQSFDYPVPKGYTINEIILYLLFLPFVVNHFYGGGVLVTALVYWGRRVFLFDLGTFVKIC